MKIPNKINIIGIEYNVSINNLLSAQQISGRTIHNEKKIILATTNSCGYVNAPQEEWRIFLHEWNHAWFNELGLWEYRDDERLVEQAASAQQEFLGQLFPGFDKEY